MPSVGLKLLTTLRSRVGMFYQLSQLRLYLAKAVVGTLTCDTNDLEDNYSWSLNNTGLNYVGPLICGFFYREYCK